MKNSYSTYGLLFFALSAVVQLTGCGLKYTPPPSPETIEEERRFALQEQLNRDFSTIGKKYTGLTYGELVVVKPSSYKKLDSLYAVKYRNRPQKRPDLEQQIETQQAIISNDTTPVLYVETHWYELAQDTLLEYLTSEISMKKNNAIVNVKNLDYFQTSRYFGERARIFMKEESFLSQGAYPSENELLFYSVYKTRAASLKGDEKDAFMQHTFRIMTKARKLNTLSTEALLRSLTQEWIMTNPVLADPALLAYTIEEINDTTSGKPVFQYYLVTVTSNPQKDNPMFFRYNAYLEMIQ